MGQWLFDHRIGQFDQFLRDQDVGGFRQPQVEQGSGAAVAGDWYGAGGLVGENAQRGAGRPLTLFLPPVSDMFESI